MTLTYRTVFLGILTWVSVLLSGSAWAESTADGFAVYADSVQAGQGEEVALRVSIANAYALSSFTVPLVYDTTVLTLKAVSFVGSRTEYLANKLTTPASVADIHGHFLVAAFQMFEDPIPAGDGPVFTCVFNVAASAPVGTVAVIDTLFYPPGGELVVVRADQPGAVHPDFRPGHVVVRSFNRSPVFASLSDQYVLEGDSLAVNITVTDPDNDQLVLAATSKPTGASFVDRGDGTARFAWTPDYVGPNSADGSPVQVGFWASDGNLSSLVEMTVYVLDRNRPPRISGPEAVSLEAGEAVEVTISALDPDFEDVDWSWSGLPAGATFTGTNPGRLTWQSALTDSGAVTARFIASDPQGLSDTLAVNLSVRAVALYTLTLDSVAAFPGGDVDFALRLDNKFPVSSFNALFNYDPSALSLVAVTAQGTRAEAFEYFNVVPNDKGVPGNVRVVGIADLGGSALRLAPGDGPIATGTLHASGDLAYAGLSTPLYFRFLDAPVYDDNTLGDSAGAKISRENIVYVSGEVKIHDVGQILIGDINLNGIAAEIGDVIYFTNYFINPFLYNFDALQYANSDVNGDHVAATVSDLVALINWVVTGRRPSAKVGKVGEVPELSASWWQDDSGGAKAVGFESDFDMGAALVILRTDRMFEPGMITNLAPDMSMDYRQDGATVRILMYSWSGRTLPQGRTELFAVEGVKELMIEEVALGSADGRQVTVAAASSENLIPAGYLLGQNYPNPFNPMTIIDFALPNPARVKLTVYNVLGQQVRLLADGEFPAGAHEVTWNGSDDSGQPVSSGVYLYRLSAGGKALTRKMVLMK